MPQTWSDWLGMGGFVIACLTLAWQVWSHRSERAERIEVKLTREEGIHCPLGTIIAEITNIGRAPVFIKNVTIDAQLNGRAQHIVRATVQEVGTNVGLTLFDGSPNPLRPGDSCRVWLSPDMAPICVDLARYHPHRLSLVVRSQKHILARLPGDRFHDYLRWTAEKIRASRQPPPAIASGSVFG